MKRCPTYEKLATLGIVSPVLSTAMYASPTSGLASLMYAKKSDRLPTVGERIGYLTAHCQEDALAPHMLEEALQTVQTETAEKSMPKQALLAQHVWRAKQALSSMPAQTQQPSTKLTR